MKRALVLSAAFLLAMGIVVNSCKSERFCLIKTPDGEVECYVCMSETDCQRCAAAGGKIDLLDPGPCKGCMETDMSNCS